MATRALYFRLSPSEAKRFLERPHLIRKLDVRVPMADGRAIDLGRGWEEIGCLLEGGISVPRSGPMIGEVELWQDASGAWSYLSESRVSELAPSLVMTRADFYRIYRVEDDEDTQDRLPHEQTGKSATRADYLFKKLERLAAHYRDASDRGEAMLVRITEHVPEGA